MEECVQVEGHQIIQALDIRIVHGAMIPDPGAVNQDLGRAERGVTFVNKPTASDGIPEVGGQGDAVGDGARDSVGLIRAGPVMHRHRGPCPAELQRDGAADTARGTGDEGHPAGQSKRVVGHSILQSPALNLPDEPDKVTGRESP